MSPNVLFYDGSHVALFIYTSALPMGFLPESHPHKLMINYICTYDKIVSISPVHFNAITVQNWPYLSADLSDVAHDATCEMTLFLEADSPIYTNPFFATQFKRSCGDLITATQFPKPHIVQVAQGDAQKSQNIP